MASGAWQGSRSRGFPPKVRAHILRRDPICRCGGCRNHVGLCTQPSTEADHVVNVANGGTDDPANGQGMCTPCHAAKTQSEAMRTRTQRSRRRPAEPHPGLRRTS